MSIFISASAISDFILCQTQAYYRIFKPELKIPSDSMILGSIVHKALEKHWKNRDDAIMFAIERVNASGFSGVHEQSAIHFISTFFDHFYGYVSDDDKVEQRFKINLFGDVYLVGVFDRVSNGNIFDWKTSSNVPKKLGNDPQFILYKYAYKHIYGNDPASLYLASLKDGSLIRYRESEVHTRELFEKIIPEYVRVIRSKSFMKNGLFNGSCYSCIYKSHCLEEK